MDHLYEREPVSGQVDVWAVRHIEIEGNAAGRMEGAIDSPASARGLRQAEAIARRLREYKFAVVYRGTLGRHRTTTDAIAYGRDIPAVEDARLNEQNNGSWEGRIKSQIPNDELVAWREGYICPPGGESRWHVAARVLQFFEEAVAACAERGGGRILFVTSGTPLQAIFYGAVRREPVQRWHRIGMPKNTGLYVARQTELGDPRFGEWELMLDNCIQHLNGI